VLVGMALSSIFGVCLIGAGQSLAVWASAVFIVAALMPLTNASSQAIWQAKVPPDLQGRVFAARLLIARVCFPLGLVIAGPLADLFFEPQMQSGGTLAETFGWLVGVGPGAGMGLMFVGSGLLGMIVALGAYAMPQIRELEANLPDHSA
jgi:MFS transporter, DHA3 family, macrolide efflux protein